MADPEVVEAPGQIPRCRPFNMGDAMILVAAVAGSMAHARWSHVLTQPYNTLLHEEIVHIRPMPIAVAYFVGLLHGIALAFSAAFVAIRLRSPRPGVATLARQLSPPVIIAYAAWVQHGPLPARDRAIWESIPTVCIAIVLGSTAAIWSALHPKEVGWMARMSTTLVGLWVADLGVWVAYSLIQRNGHVWFWNWDRWIVERLGL